MGKGNKKRIPGKKKRRKKVFGSKSGEEERRSYKSGCRIPEGMTLIKATCPEAIARPDHAVGLGKNAREGAFG